MSARSKIRKITKWALYALVFAFFVFFYGVVPWFLTGIATTSRFHFRDPNDKKTPKDFGMEFQTVEFPSTDGLKLRGWYVPAAQPTEARGTIIYLHGHNRTRVEMLPEAQYGHQLGYDGLLFDLRHQGQSEGKISTVGYQERLDAEGAVRFVLSQEKAKRPIIVWGVSMGAAAGLMAAADSPDVAAVISDSTFLNYRELIMHHYELFLGIIRRQWWWFPPLPAFPLADEVLYWSAWRGNFKPSDFDLEKAVKEINPRPILFVAVEGDPRMPPEYAKTLYGDATSSLKEIIVLGGSRHGEGFRLATKQYEDAVSRFLNTLPADGQVASSPHTEGH